MHYVTFEMWNSCFNRQSNLNCGASVFDPHVGYAMIRPRPMI